MNISRGFRRLSLTVAMIGATLSGCVVGQLDPGTHLVTVEPDGSVIKDECVTPTQLGFPTIRMECQENGGEVFQECNLEGCTYTKNGKVFRECKQVSLGFFSTETEKDCIENGIHISRKCKHEWNTFTCKEALLQ